MAHRQPAPLREPLQAQRHRLELEHQIVPEGTIEPEMLILGTLRLKVAPVGDYSTYTLSLFKDGFDPLFGELPFKFRPGCFNLNCAPDWEASQAPGEAPAIDYLARDYDSFRHVLIAAMMQRVPDWQPTSEADLDQVLIDLLEEEAAHDHVTATAAVLLGIADAEVAEPSQLLEQVLGEGLGRLQLLDPRRERLFGEAADGGAKRVLLAGRPKEQECALKSAGVETFIFAGCDAIATLASLHKALGVDAG